MTVTTTKPSQRTVREQIEARIHEGTLPDVSELLDLHDGHVAAVTAIDDRPWIETEKVAQRAALASEFKTKRAVAIADAIRRASAELGQREGRLRAALRDAGADPEAIFKQNRAATFAKQVEQALAVPDVERVFENAMLTEDADAIHAAGAAGRKRLSDLADVVRNVPAKHAAAQAACLAFNGRYQQWARTHPSPAQELDSIVRERHNVAVAIEQAAEFMTRLYCIAAPAPTTTELKPVPIVTEPRGRLVFGRAFDLLADPRARR